MVNQELVKRLLKELEAEKGCPVQLRADTPESERYVDGSMVGGREYFGLFSERGVVVRGVGGLDKMYLSDVKLIEGEYKSLEDLQRKIQELNALHDYPGQGSLAERAYQLVRNETGVADLVGNSLAWNFKEFGAGGKVSAENVHKILDKAGLTYLKHNVVARPDGVYDDRTIGGSLSVVDETKVADITLKLIE